MVLQSRVVVPPTFRPDHHVGRVLSYIDIQLEHRRGSARRSGEQLTIEGVYGPRWNLRYSGRGRIAFAPLAGGFRVEVSVLREALWTAVAAPAALLVIRFTDGPLTSEQFLWAGLWVVVTAGLWLAGGVYKLRMLRGVVQRGIAQVASAAV